MSRLRGRFSRPTDPEMDRFASSIEIDLVMAQDDIAGSRAHAIMLGETGIISSEDADSLVQGLDRIALELESGEFAPTVDHEDIHMAVEARLEELLGEIAGRLHTARSRNDQVATDVRLWLLRELAGLDRDLRQLMQALLDRVRSDGQILMPGYTHLQRGQPILQPPDDFVSNDLAVVVPIGSGDVSKLRRLTLELKPLDDPALIDVILGENVIRERLHLF